MTTGSAHGSPAPDYDIRVYCNGRRLRGGGTSHPNRSAHVARVEHLVLDPAPDGGRRESWGVIPVTFGRANGPVDDLGPEVSRTIDEGTAQPVDAAQLSRARLKGQDVQSHTKHVFACTVCGLDVQDSRERLAAFWERLRDNGITEIPLYAVDEASRT